MREILFRGKRLDGCSWIEGYYVEQYKAQMIYIPNVEVYGDEYYHIIPETISEFCGLTDKNGKKIFEGDIIACKNYDEELVVEGVVKYGKFNCSCCDGVYGWYIDGGDIRRLDDWMVDDSNAEVIGNIYDNPELIKEQENEQ